tara:strand:- start:9864 stop:11867 length:2004 start_codon:yes stop_codon:yes gene_type:complete
MAEVVAISLQVDSGNSVNEVKKLEDAIKDINNSSSTNTIEQKFKTLNTTLESNTASFGEMSQAIEAYKTIALNAGRTSPVGKEALKNASILKDRITDLDREVDNLAQDGRRMQGAMQISQGVMGGYSAFIGITALAGEGNEALEKTLVKLTATMSIMQGIEQIRLATEKESSSMKLLLGARTKVLTALNFLYTASIGATTGAMKLLRIALLSTGIGALVVLLGYIIAKWDDWKDTVISFIKGALSPLVDVLQYLGIVESDLEKERRTNHENEMRRIQERRDSLGSVRDKAEQDLKNEIAIANARGENTDKSQKKLLKLTRDNAQKRIDDNNALLEEIESGNRTATEEEYENTQDSIIADRKLREGAEQDLKVFDATKSKERREARKVQSENKTEAQRKEDELMLQLQKDLEDIIIENERDEDIRELARFELKQNRDLEALRLKYGLETTLEKELLINQNNEMNDLIDSIELENKVKADEKAQKEKEERDRIKAENDKESKERIQKERNEAESIIGFKQDILMNSVQAFGQLSNLLSKNEKLQKGAALAEIATGTAIGFINALDIAQKSAKATGPAAAFAMPVFYASQVVAVLGAASKARSLLGGGGGGVTPPSISAPSTDTSTINSQSNNGDGSGGFNLPTNRVVLVESDLRMMQERRNNSDIISTI